MLQPTYLIMIGFLKIKTSVLVTHVCSTESVDEGLSFSSGRLWSNKMVSVLARQNPLDRMISVDTECDIGSAVRSAELHAAKLPPVGTWYLDWTLEARLDSVDFVIPQHLVQRWSLKECQHHLWPGILWRQVFSGWAYTAAHSQTSGLSNNKTADIANISDLTSSDSMRVAEEAPCRACWSHSSVVFPPHLTFPRCRLPLWFSEALK